MIRNNRKVVLHKQPNTLNRKNDITSTSTASSKTSVYQILRRKNDAHICVIRSVGGIGDVLMTLPAVAQLKEDFPSCRITYATDRHSTKEDVYYQVVKNVPFIDYIIDARYIDRGKFDGVIDISSVCIKHENSGAPMLNRIDIFSRACGIPRLKNPVPFYRVEPSEKEYAKNLLAPVKNKKLLVLHTASFDNKRTWPLNRQLQLLTLLAEQRPDIQVLLSDFNNLIPNKKNLPNVTDITNPSFRLLAATIAEADLFLGPDSGPMHLTGAIKKQSIVLFGSIPPAVRINHYKTHTAMVAEPRLPCLGCFYKPCNINFKCMTDISAERVLARINESI